MRNMAVLHDAQPAKWEQQFAGPRSKLQGPTAASAINSLPCDKSSFAFCAQLAKTPTCGDTDVTKPGDQPWTCPRGSKANSSMMAAGPPSDALCCLVSLLRFSCCPPTTLIHMLCKNG
jgi:hypothetical protein